LLFALCLRGFHCFCLFQLNKPQTARSSALAVAASPPAPYAHRGTSLYAHPSWAARPVVRLFPALCSPGITHHFHVSLAQATPTLKPLLAATNKNPRVTGPRIPRLSPPPQAGVSALWASFISRSRTVKARQVLPHLLMQARCLLSPTMVVANDAHTPTLPSAGVSWGGNNGGYLTAALTRPIWSPRLQPSWFQFSTRTDTCVPAPTHRDPPRPAGLDVRQQTWTLDP